MYANEIAALQREDQVREAQLSDLRRRLAADRRRKRLGLRAFRLSRGVGR